MVFIITGSCCSDASCIDVCPVDCIRPNPSDPDFTSAGQLYIDPSTCIGCSACMYACPVSAIHDERELPTHLDEFRAINREHFEENPLVPRFIDVESRPVIEPIAARVAVIGAGPSACYAIAELSEVPGIEVTVFERLPTPFGLVRSGVAPDHPDTKLIAEYFQTVLERPEVTCFFNVEVGVHITLDEIRRHHDAVIYAGGAGGERSLGIEGEQLTGSVSSREFVAWYNGHPDFADKEFAPTGRAAVIIGNGNVALDVARVIAQPNDTYASTDMADHAIDALRASEVTEVVIVARRGPAEAACTLPELLELSTLPGVDVCALTNEVDIENDAELSRSAHRKVELFRKFASSEQNSSPGRTRITFRFGWRPVRIDGVDDVESVHLCRVDDPDVTQVVPTGFVVRAVGHRVAPIDGFPFDETRATIANVDGRIVNETGHLLEDLYCVGWAKRGPSGVIGTNRACARETVAALLSDLRGRRSARREGTLREFADFLARRQPDLVTLSGWNVLDEVERAAGRDAPVPRPRRKLVRVSDMVQRVRASGGEHASWEQESASVGGVHDG